MEEDHQPVTHKVTKCHYQKYLQDDNSSSSSLQVNTLARDEIPQTVQYRLLLMKLEIPIYLMQPSHLVHTTYLKVKEIKTAQKTRFVNYMVTLRNRNSATSDSHTRQMKSGFFLYNPKIIA